MTLGFLKERFPATEQLLKCRKDERIYGSYQAATSPAYLHEADMAFQEGVEVLFIDDIPVDSSSVLCPEAPYVVAGKVLHPLSVAHTIPGNNPVTFYRTVTNVKEENIRQITSRLESLGAESCIVGVGFDLMTYLRETVPVIR